MPNKPRGVPRVNDRKVLNGIYWRLRTDSPWADIPERYGPPTTCYNRFVRWRKLGVWDRIFEAVSAAYDGDLQIVDSSSIRVHQHAANVKRGASRKVPPRGTSLSPDSWGARMARDFQHEEVPLWGNAQAVAPLSCQLPSKRADEQVT